MLFEEGAEDDRYYYKEGTPKQFLGLVLSFFRPLCFVSVVSCIVLSFHGKNIPLWYFRGKGRQVAVDSPVHIGKERRGNIPSFLTNPFATIFMMGTSSLLCKGLSGSVPAEWNIVFAVRRVFDTSLLRHLMLVWLLTCSLATRIRAFICLAAGSSDKGWPPQR